ncbi:HNH endonuclease signature motif containing protein [Marinilactibacillus psychrotolerans]|uniref:HNH nuclease domain-containing protein n=1 Tax=Marinilactibacillus psychrotolerans TaxID=191770 RepID=A0AAV3WS49_9LACT|nr:HNH endonuclease signature motif containing protein [Marinilactibacillus psychrotolerans]GEL67231.1 hypothetical protein MPS01_13860 [Marinilactibacillus psychrotolerans]GEQ36035.1 hypothetical protein M132T_15430 [Marinilactibacillus psychrotolerans]SDC60746.1 HNH endonuclease [Marinilactibacillus psychrotolerans]
MPKNKYTDAHIEYLRKISSGRHTYDMAQMFNKKFNMNITEGQLKSLKSRYKIKSNVKRKRRTPNKKLFTDEQFQFIKENAVGIGNQELAKRINEKYGLLITPKQLSAWKKNHNIKSGLTGHFNKGRIPENKGQKQSEYMTTEAIEKSKATRFKVGQKPKNYKPVGTEVIASDGYWRVKVQDEGEWYDRWKLKHKILWEKENGPVPNGKILTFLDGNKLNIDLDNLKLVTRAEHLAMTRQNLRFDDPELTKVGAAIAAVSVKRYELNNRDDVQ